MASSLIKRSAIDKFNTLAARMSLVIAKKSDPALYGKYAKARKLYIGLKENITKKYFSQGKKAAKLAARKKR